MNSDYKFISEDDFERIWGVKKHPSGDFFQHKDVIAHPLNCVWTVVESGDDADGNWYASPGYHVVNKLGYVLTSKPWDDITQDAIYFLDDMDDDSSDAEENV